MEPHRKVLSMLVCATVIWFLTSLVTLLLVFFVFVLFVCLFAYAESLGQHAGISPPQSFPSLPRVVHWGSSCHLL